MHLILLRHGQTESNVIGALDTAVPGAPLTPFGERQAASVPAALADQDVDAIFVSTLTRTQQTAAPLAAARDLEPRMLDGLREIAAGDLEMLSDHKSQGIYNATAFAWAQGDLDVRMPGGENGHEFFTRFDDAIDEARASGGYAVAVSHGAAIRTWVAARCVNTDGSFAGDHQLDNTAAAYLIEEDGRWRLLDWHGEPVGGIALADNRAADPIGHGTNG
jgi:broad specificity phosphatase PhoE